MHKQQYTLLRLIYMDVVIQEVSIHLLLFDDGWLNLNIYGKIVIEHVYIQNRSVY